MHLTHSDLITKFYTAFAAGNAADMNACYHSDILFQDPAFGKLRGERAKNMWLMLLSNKSANTRISYSNIMASESVGHATWKAEYVYGKSKRPVVNKIQANFKFKEGKIIEHTDTFDLWNWSRQALGVPGYMLGWSAYMRTKIQQTTKDRLDKYMGT